MVEVGYDGWADDWYFARRRGALHFACVLVAQVRVGGGG